MHWQRLPGERAEFTLRELTLAAGPRRDRIRSLIVFRGVTANDERHNEHGVLIYAPHPLQRLKQGASKTWPGLRGDVGPSRDGVVVTLL